MQDKFLQLVTKISQYRKIPMDSFLVCKAESDSVQIGLPTLTTYLKHLTRGEAPHDRYTEHFPQSPGIHSPRTLSQKQTLYT